MTSPGARSLIEDSRTAEPLRSQSTRSGAEGSPYAPVPLVLGTTNPPPPSFGAVPIQQDTKWAQSSPIPPLQEAPVGTGCPAPILAGLLAEMSGHSQK